MSDLVERLREHADATLPGNIPPGPVQTVPRALLRQAADALTELGRIAMETATDLSCLQCDVLEVVNGPIGAYVAKGTDSYVNGRPAVLVSVEALQRLEVLCVLPPESPVPNESPPSGECAAPK